MSPNIPCDSDAAHAADSRADLLYRRHQRKRKEHGPEHAVAVLSSDLRIGGNPAGIVIRCSGNQTRAEFPENLPGPGMLVLLDGGQLSLWSLGVCLGGHRTWCHAISAKAK